MITRSLKVGHPALLVHIPNLPRPVFGVNSLRSYIALVMASLTLCLAVLMLVVRTGAIAVANTTSPDNPFIPYSSIMPGHPAAGLDEHHCRTAFDRNSTPPCSIVPDDGPFHLVNVTRRHDVITEVSFFSQTLQLGDLIHQWGEPDSMHRSANGRAITVVWNAGSNQFSATMALRGTQPHVRVVTARMNCDASNAGTCSQPS